MEIINLIRTQPIGLHWIDDKYIHATNGFYYILIKKNMPKHIFLKYFRKKVVILGEFIGKFGEFAIYDCDGKFIYSTSDELFPKEIGKDFYKRSIRKVIKKNLFPDWYGDFRINIYLV